MIEARLPEHHYMYSMVATTYETYEALLASPYFNDVIYISMKQLQGPREIDTWPPNLQILNCTETKIEAFNNLPRTLRSLYARTNKLAKFPSIEHCSELETIDLYDNYIEQVNVDIPRSCRSIDVSFNKIRSIAYERIHHECHITASYCFLSSMPPCPFDQTMVYDHNDIKAYDQRPVVRGGPGRQQQHGARLHTYATQIHRPRMSDTSNIQVYTSAQNVHTSSVQDSANDALVYILKYVPHEKCHGDKFVEDILKLYEKYKSKKVAVKFLWWTLPFKCKPKSGVNDFLPLRHWVNDITIHSVHGVSFRPLKV